MKRTFLIINLVLCMLVSLNANAKKQTEKVNAQAFELLVLDRPGLETVKAMYKKGKTDKAAAALLNYYRQRTSIVDPDINLNNIKVSKRKRQWADDALEHTFYVHDGYQPAYM